MGSFRLVIELTRFYFVWYLEPVVFELCLTLATHAAFLAFRGLELCCDRCRASRSTCNTLRNAFDGAGNVVFRMEYTCVNVVLSYHLPSNTTVDLYFPARGSL